MSTSYALAALLEPLCAKKQSWNLFIVGLLTCHRVVARLGQLGAWQLVDWEIWVQIIMNESYELTRLI